MVLGVLVVIMIALIGGIIGFLASGGSAGPTSGTVNNASEKFEDLTKGEALELLRQSKNTQGGVLPDGYVGEEITGTVVADGNTIVSRLELISSYDDIEGLTQMAREKYLAAETGAESSFETTEYNYYAIVTPGQESGANSLLAFRREYLSDIEDVYYFNNFEPGVVNYLLRTYTVARSGGYGNIYSYDFKDEGDKFVLTNNYISVGINMEILNNSGAGNSISQSEMTAINLFRRSIAVDKSTGQVYTVTTDDGKNQKWVKSFPLSEEEIIELVGKQ